MPLSPRIGRILSVVGAAILVVSLFLVWYDVARLPIEGSTTSTGWDTFPRLRVIIVLGALATIATALVHQVRPVLIARTLLGLVLAALILRRVLDPPLIDAPVSSTFGVYVGLAGAVLVALGGLVDSGREVVARYPDLGFNRPPAGELPSAAPAPTDPGPVAGEAVDADPPRSQRAR